VFERAPEGRFQVFLISLNGLQALSFWTQDSASLGPRYAVVRGKPPRLAMLDV
jgi:hypothetical protein